MVAIPKPASTVVLMDNESRIYLTKRPKTMKFMGGFYVFPGGGMDDADQLVNEKYVKSESKNDSLTMGHYIAAARELFEEVGILLGNKEDGSPVILSKKKELIYRNQLVNREITFGEILEREEIFFHLKCLSYIGQLVTPSQSHIRFDTRFFLVMLPQGQQPHPDRSEIDDAFWIAPEEALDLFENKKLKLSAPTILTLEAVIKYLNGEKLHISASEIDLLKMRRNITGF
ncbi:MULTISPECIES: NUDIX hydrolase [Bacillaceae]|uniref:NUDIX hydrolase n=1 Tax=Bacillaceae TaxID=186817 RepID=UPI0011A8055C|nr:MULTISPECIES: NUDIX hydrolase [Bacillaceae]MBU8791863.1 NUDIX hydrolase [Oceanobacillus caeni]MED4475259.1 NUDIX hydrolase [Oceanobacillus caeni]